MKKGGNTLVIDTGLDIVGVYSVEDGIYTPYRGNRRTIAVARVRVADEVVTYNGTELGQKWSDLRELARLAGCHIEVLLRGMHTDMQRVCWDPIRGSALSDTYQKVFGTKLAWGEKEEALSSDRKYVLSNRHDVQMTFELWDRWTRRTLEINGQLR